MEVLFQDARLALRIAESTEPLEFLSPDALGTWRVRMQPSVVIRFTAEDGRVASCTARGSGRRGDLHEDGFTRAALRRVMRFVVAQRAAHV